MAVVKNLMVRAGADFSGMRKEMKKAQQDLSSFKSSVSSALKGIAVTLATLGIGSFVKDATKDAMSFEASMQQIDRQMGASAAGFKNWAKESASAFGMSQLEAAKFGAIYSNLIRGFSKGTAETAQRTQDLLKASAIVASSTGRTMEDTMERIRSGLLGNTEAIEDLGINVNVSMIESTNAFKKFANGKSWQQLDFQTQQQIRLFGILEQAATKYGDEIANNTTSRQQQFIAQLNNAKLALGQAFLPIYNAILPALIKFATALANVMSLVAQFSRALFGVPNETKQQTKAANDQAGAVTGLGNAYKKAGKKAKGAIASFDELNLVGGKSGSGDAAEEPAAGGGSGIDESMLSGVGDTMSEVSEKAKAMAAKVKSAFGAMKDFIVKNKDIIISALAGLAAAFASFWIATKWGSVVTAIQTAGRIILGVLASLSLPITIVVTAIGALVAAFVYFYRTNEKFRNTVQNIMKAIGEAATALWENVMVPFGKWLGSVMVAAWEAVGDATKWLWDNVMKPFGAWLADVLPIAWKAVETAVVWLWKNVLIPFGDFLLWIWKNVIVPLAKILADVLGVAFKFVADVAKSFWQNVLVPLGKALKEMFGPAVEAVSAVLTVLWKNVLSPLASFLGTVLKGVLDVIITVLTFLWQNVLKPLTEFVGGVLKSVFENVFKGIGDIINGLKKVFTGLMDFITGVFTGDWKRAWEGVKGIFKGVFDALYGIVKVPLNLIIDAINSVIGGLNKISFDMPEWMGGGTFGMSIKPIPKLAKGGLAYGPTLAMVGDNKGASSDPEVVAPLSKLEGIMGGGDRETLGVLNLILRAIQSGQNIDVTISQSAITQAAVSGIRDIQRRTGALPFTP